MKEGFVMCTINRDTQYPDPLPLSQRERGWAEGSTCYITHPRSNDRHLISARAQHACKLIMTSPPGFIERGECLVNDKNMHVLLWKSEITCDYSVIRGCHFERER